MNEQVSERSRLAAALMAFFFGWLGVHRFYVGKTGTAILMVLTFGGVGIWATIPPISKVSISIPARTSTRT